MTGSKQVREFLISKGIKADSIGIIYNDKRKSSRRYKIWIYGGISQKLANRVGDGLSELGCCGIGISLREIIFSVPDKNNC
jgi:hypothetical protein